MGAVLGGDLTGCLEDEVFVGVDVFCAMMIFPKS
ncbi:hypothetical protein V757_01935 [Pelistega indica]|uniref:Uncharacterized protein n=1 Tax=Pelistega indica TaxID=1414851 RepID=V8GA44_9BURK|nr:hypothetical protein V757_01935 [Pelistega indica]